MINEKYLKALSTKAEEYIGKNSEGYLFRLHNAGEVRDIFYEIRDENSNIHLSHNMIYDNEPLRIQAALLLQSIKHVIMESSIHRLHLLTGTKKTTTAWHVLRDIASYHDRCTPAYIIKNREKLLHLFEYAQNREPLNTKDVQFYWLGADAKLMIESIQKEIPNLIEEEKPLWFTIYIPLKYYVEIARTIRAMGYNIRIYV